MPEHVIRINHITASTEELAIARAIAAARGQGIQRPRVIAMDRVLTGGPISTWSAQVTARAADAFEAG
jgi:hypothetical protein